MNKKLDVSGGEGRWFVYRTMTMTDELRFLVILFGCVLVIVPSPGPLS